MIISIPYKPLSILILLGYSLFTPLFAQQTFYTFAEQTNVREEASSDSKKTDQLIAGEEVYSLAERSTNSTLITYKGQSLNGVWEKVVTQSGKQGWIHEALLLDKMPNTEYYAWVDQLRVRKEPTLDAEVLELLSVNDVVKFTGERSLKKDRIQLRNQNEAFFWMKVNTLSGNTGWVYGGGLKLKQQGSATIPSIDIEIPGSKELSGTDAVRAESLRVWWQSLKPEWRTFFNERVLKKDLLELYKMPTTAELESIRVLKEINLSNNDECGTGPFYSVPLMDLSGLEELSALERVYCDYISFDNLFSLTKLPKLQQLSICNSSFNSLAGLEQLQNLNWLDLSLGLNQSLDLSLLKSLSQLRELYIETDKISELNGLRSLLKLKKLIIKCSEIQRLDGIDALFNLEHLSIVAKQSTLDLRPLESLKQLDYCSIIAFEADFSEIFAKCSALTYLIFSTVEGRFDLNIIANLPHLRELEIRSANLLNAEALTKIKSLRALYLSSLESFDFNSIQACSDLWALEIEAERILNLQSLGNFRKLSRLGILSDGLASIKELPALSNLQQLRIKSINLQSLEGINRFPKSYSLDFSECQKLDSVEEINQLKELIELYIPAKILFEDSRIQAIRRPGLDIRNKHLSGC